ncbi:MAG: hypothetical protein J5I65_03925 [Aridibacter famidurans]|nr:hypothetical protein [Aridibacter famidurans]
MRTTLTHLGAALIGAVLGGILTVYLIVGVPEAASVPGEPLKQASEGTATPAVAVVSLDQRFFDSLLETIFSDMTEPAFPLKIAREARETDPVELASAQGPQQFCEEKLTVLREGSGVKTAVRFDKGKITVPMAFRGSVSVLGACVSFSGWSSSSLALKFDEETNTVFGEIDVETVNLDGVPPFAGKLVAGFVQNGLNRRVNPITVVKGEQMRFRVPIEATNGVLNAAISDVRSEIVDDEIRLTFAYEFEGLAKE